jgi:hypothetical protein
MLQAILDWFTGWRFWFTDRLRGELCSTGRDIIKTKNRSSKWPRVRREHLAREPQCQWCAAKSKLEVHHLRPFHLFPELELDDGKDGTGKDGNLITLCECHTECHLRHGHLGRWVLFNENIRKQCEDRRHERESHG